MGRSLGPDIRHRVAPALSRRYGRSGLKTPAFVADIHPEAGRIVSGAIRLVQNSRISDQQFQAGQSPSQLQGSAVDL